MGLNLAWRTLKDFVTQKAFKIALLDYGNGSFVGLHGLVDSNGAPVDPLTDETGAQILSDLQNLLALAPVGGAVDTKSAQTISGVKTFSASPLVVAPAAADNSQAVASTSWVQALLTAFLAKANTWSGGQVFETGSSTTAPISTNANEYSALSGVVNKINLFGGGYGFGVSGGALDHIAGGGGNHQWWSGGTKVATLFANGAFQPVSLAPQNGLANTYLATMPALTLKANIGGAASSPSDATMTSIFDAVFGTTQGLVLTRGAGGWVAQAPSVFGAPRAGVRQTVQSGPASSGIPTFLPNSSASLTLTAQAVSASIPLVVSAGQGFNATGQADAVIALTSNPSWTLTANTTAYLFINASTGATSVSTLQPIYQAGGPISTTNGQFTFDYVAMIGYLGNGSAAVATPLVCVGEAVAGSSGGVNSTIAYAYNGYAETAAMTTAPAVGTNTAFNTNLGVAAPAVLDFTFTSAANGYSIGDKLSLLYTNDSTLGYNAALVQGGRNTCSFTTSSTGNALFYRNKGTNGAVAIAGGAALGGNLKLIHKRGW